MKVHIQRTHNGLGVPLLLDTQTFHETEGYAVRSIDSMESPLNYYGDIDPQAIFCPRPIRNDLCQSSENKETETNATPN